MEELEKIGGTPVHEILEHLVPGQAENAESLVAVSLTWPMGFSWSSFVAQELLLDTYHAGFSEKAILSCNAVTPMSFELVFAAATDDLMIFSDAGPGHTLSAAQQVDAEFQGRGALRNAGNDRCLAMVVSLLQLLQHCRASPKQVRQYLGVQQLFDLLCRSKLSVYNHVYGFVRDAFDDTRRKIPSKVLFEMSAGLLLGIFWLIDLRRPFLPLVSATDASTSFGFGASLARVPSTIARRLPRISEKQGAFVVLDEGTVSAQSASRLGQAHGIDISKDEFVRVLSGLSCSGCGGCYALENGIALERWFLWTAQCGWVLPQKEGRQHN